MRFGSMLIVAIAATLAVAFGGSAMAANVYVPSYGVYQPEAIAGFARAADGSLSPLTGSPFAVGPPGSPSAVSGLFGLAFTPDGTRGVAPFYFSGGVVGLSAALDGSLAPVPSPILTPSASAVAVTPDGRFAYVPTRTFPPMVKGIGIMGFSIGPEGALATLSSSPFGSAESYNDVAITPDGRSLFAVRGSAVEAFSIGADGTLTEEAPPKNVGASTLAISPDGRFLFVTRTSPNPNSVASLSIGADGGLDENGDPAEIVGTGLGYISVAPDGSNVYMPAEFDDAIHVASVAADGDLTVAGSTPADHPSTSAVSPDGRFLYFGRDDTTSGALGVAAIGPDGGLTVLPPTAPWKSGEPVRIQLQPAPAPIADLVVRRAAPGEASGLNGLGSSRAARYDWDFGDGTGLVDGGPLPTHVYESAGVYRVKLTVFDGQGCSTREIYTGQSTTCPGGASAATTGTVDTLPAIGRLTAKPRRFAARDGKRRGTKLRYRLTEAARVRFVISRRRAGRRVGRRCMPAKKRARKGGRPCSLFAKRGAFAVSGRSGGNRTRFNGVLKGRALPPGPYRATAIATDSTEGHSTPRSASFRIIGLRRRR